MKKPAKKNLVALLTLVGLLLVGGGVIFFLVKAVVDQNTPAPTDPEVSFIQSPDETTPALTTPPTRVGEHVRLNLLPPDPPKKAGIVRRWAAHNALEYLHRPIDTLTQIASAPYDAKPLQGITVFLDAARGGEDPGATFPHEGEPEFKEKDITLQVAYEAKDALEALGAGVVLIREDDTKMGLYHRSARVGMTLVADYKVKAEMHGLKADRLWNLMGPLRWIADNNVDAGGGDFLSGETTTTEAKLLYDLQAQYDDAILISLQVNNWPDDPKAHGIQVAYLTNAVDYKLANEAIEADESVTDAAQVDPVYQFRDDVNRERLATLLLDTLHETIPASATEPAREDKLQHRYSVLRHNNLTSAVLSLGYISNDEDRRMMTEPDSQRQLGLAIADAVYAYYRDYPTTTVPELENPA